LPFSRVASKTLHLLYSPTQAYILCYVGALEIRYSRSDQRVGEGMVEVVVQVGGGGAWSFSEAALDISPALMDSKAPR
jgi:hypothetical protein